MEFDFNESLEQLAEAFNTTVENLYPILITQAYVTGFTLVVLGAVTFLITLTIFIAMLKAKKKKEAEDKYGWDWEDDGWMYIGALILSGVIMIISNGIMIMDAPTALFNPEYWAIKEIISTIK